MNTQIQNCIALAKCFHYDFKLNKHDAILKALEFVPVDGVAFQEEYRMFELELIPYLESKI